MSTSGAPVALCGWGTSKYPIATDGVLATIAIIIGVGVGTVALSRWRGGSLYALLRFHRNANFLTAVVAVNAAIMCGMSINVALFADENDDTTSAFPMKFLGENTTGAFKAGAVALGMEAVVTAILCIGLARSVGPWDAEAWAADFAIARWITYGLQGWCVVVLTLAWLSRAAVIHAQVYYNGSDGNCPFPDASNHLVSGLIATAIFQSLFVASLAARATWCGVARYESFTCAVCDGNPATGTGACDVCVDGLQFHPL